MVASGLNVEHANFWIVFKRHFLGDIDGRKKNIGRVIFCLVELKTLMMILISAFPKILTVFKLIVTCRHKGLNFFVFNFGLFVQCDAIFLFQLH